MSENRYKDIFLHLKSKNFNVYPPASKLGECTETYLVLKVGGSTKSSSISTNIDIYSVLIYVPQNKYSILDSIIQDVKKAMKELYPMIREYGVQTPSFFEEAIKAHMVSIDYFNYKKI